MNCTIQVDWKFIIALGVSIVSTILAVKMDDNAAERVATCMVDACKEAAIAGNSNR